LHEWVSARLEIAPATPDRKDDLLDLFGPNGAYSNCWCTWWLLRGRDWDATPKEGRRALLMGLVERGEAPGLIAYRDGTPVGWCAVGPRSRYERFMSPRARVYRPFDEEPTWVVNCFFIPREHRGQGIATALLDAAVRFAGARGARIVEGYPIDRTASAHTSSSLFVGSLSTFHAAGFAEVARTGDRPLVRKEL